MAVPASTTYSAAAKVAAHTAFLGLIDAGSNGLIRIRSSTDVLLAEVTMTDPAGTVNGTTGQLTITTTGPDASADASGTAAYAELCASDGTVHLAIPAQIGTVPVSGKIVLNTTTIIAGTPVTIISTTIG
jgi:hypothetical protein